jgi:phytoene desaturase (3,4-didehydrolycopene-forming)
MKGIRLLTAFLGLTIGCIWGLSVPREPLSPPSKHGDVSASSNNLPRVVVIGGGVGGLALASRLVTSIPCQVSILEMNEEMGGRCGSVEINLPDGSRFRHEKGPSLLLLPHVYRRVFEECGAGKSMEDFGLTIKPCIPAYQVVFDDGDCVDVGFPRQGRLTPNELDALETAERGSREKMDSIEKDGSVKWDAYLQACEAFLDCGLPNFIEEKLDLASFPAFLRESLRDFGKAWPLKPHSDVLDAFFESDKLRALASFQDLYVGLEPYRNEKQVGGGILDSTAPAVFGLLAAIELHPRNEKCGVYAPIGGFQSVATSLQKLAESCGVTCRTGKRVTKVSSEGVWYQEAEESTNEQDRVTTFEPADLVIVNADLPYATESLIRKDDDPQKSYFDWNDKYRFSSGVIAFHWSVNKTLPELNTHNVFLSTKSRKDAEASWTALRDASKSQPLLHQDTPFNFYVHRACMTDPTAAPEVSPESHD